MYSRTKNNEFVFLFLKKIYGPLIHSEQNLTPPIQSINYQKYKYN